MKRLWINSATIAVDSAALMLAALMPLAPATAVPNGPRNGTTHADGSGGDQLWVSRYEHKGADVATAVKVSPDGSTVYVTGTSHGSTGGDDYTTIAYRASTGHTLWRQRYDGPGDSQDQAVGLVVSTDGSTVFVAGSSTSQSGSHYATVAYDTVTGSQLWVRIYNQTALEYDVATALGVSPEGSRVFVTGSTVRNFVDRLTTIAYDAATGARAWVTSDVGYGVPASLQVSPDGTQVFVTATGVTQDLGPLPLDTFAYRASNGTMLWDHLTGDIGGARSLAVSADGTTVFTTGWVDTTSRFNTDFITIAYQAATGAELWEARYNGGVYGDAERAVAVGVSPDSAAVFVTGTSPGSTSGDDYATIAYQAATGQRLWLKRYGGTADDEPTSLGVSPDGSPVFVTGQSLAATYDYATIAHRTSDGHERWVKRYQPTTSDYASSLGVSPDGSMVFVTGESSGSTGYDYATIAYRAS